MMSDAKCPIGSKGLFARWKVLNVLMQINLTSSLQKQKEFTALDRKTAQGEESRPHS